MYNSLVQSFEFIRSKYLEKRAKNPAYSIAAFARSLGISKSYLSRVFKNERPLTLKLTVQIAIVLELSTSETEKLIASVAAETNGNPRVLHSLKARAAKKEKNTKELQLLKVEQFRMMSSWYHFAILNLTRVQNFDSRPSWIAKKLGISHAEAAQAVERLVTLGFLEREKDRLKLVKSRLLIDNPNPDLALSRYFEQTLDKAKEELKDPSKESFDARFLAAVTLPVNSAKIKRLKERLIEIQNEFLEPIEDTELTEVYQINLQFFPLTKAGT